MGFASTTRSFVLAWLLATLLRVSKISGCSDFPSMIEARMSSMLLPSPAWRSEEPSPESLETSKRLRSVRHEGQFLASAAIVASQTGQTLVSWRGVRLDLRELSGVQPAASDKDFLVSVQRMISAQFR
jgi:hypothetical protein